MRKLASPLALAVALLAGCGTGSAPSKQPASETAAPAASVHGPMGEADSLSAEVIRQMTDAMGGQKTWDNVPCFRFDFVVVVDGKEKARFSHWWDKKNGRCRVEGPDDKGRKVTAIFTLKDKKGKSFTDGIVDTDSTNTASIIQMGYERWVNDTYWIIMPFKLRDPGVHVVHDSTQRTPDGADFDVLHVSFNAGIGLTPGDHYTLYVNRQTHLIDHWDMLLQGQKPPPSSATWEGWTEVGPVKLALMHRVAGKPVMIRFENVAAPATFDETVFTYSRVRG